MPVRAPEAFDLHPHLQRDTFPLTELPLCRVVLMNNRHFSWLILVPRRPGVREIVELARADRHALMDEIALASEAMRACCDPFKLNVAALGNQVPQLHVHVIARFQQDRAWPNPVWGGEAAPYEDAGPILAAFQAAFADLSA